jgi:hypothetical protein
VVVDVAVVVEKVAVNVAVAALQHHLLLILKL